MRRKRGLSLLMLAVLLFTMIPASTAVAADDKGKNKQQQTHTISDSMFSKLGEFDAMKKKNYSIDTAPSKNKRDGFEIGIPFFGDDSVGNRLQNKIYGLFEFLIDMMFQLNVWMVKGTLTVIEQAYSFDLIEMISDEIADAVQSFAGINNGKFSTDGFFPATVQIIFVLAALWAGLQFFLLKQPNAALSSLLKTIGIVALTLVLITAMDPILKTANNITSKLSLTMMAKGAESFGFYDNQTAIDKAFVSDEQGKDDMSDAERQDAVINAIKDRTWNMMITRPYLLLQYGTDNIKEIGSDRVNRLLSSSGKKRENLVMQEVEKYSNVMMTLPQVGQRIIFTLVYMTVNTFIGIPILIASVLKMVFQVWFIIMSIFSAFALWLALFPGKERILKSYFSEWLRPLVLQIVISIGLVMIFGICMYIYTLPRTESIGYLGTMILLIVVMLAVFFLRKRLVLAFSGGMSGQLQGKLKNLVSDESHHQTSSQHSNDDDLTAPQQVFNIMNAADSDSMDQKDTEMPSVSLYDDELSTEPAADSRQGQDPQQEDPSVSLYDDEESEQVEPHHSTAEPNDDEQQDSVSLYDDTETGDPQDVPEHEDQDPHTDDASSVSLYDDTDNDPDVDLTDPETRRQSLRVLSGGQDEALSAMEGADEMSSSMSDTTETETAATADEKGVSLYDEEFQDDEPEPSIDTQNGQAYATGEKGVSLYDEEFQDQESEQATNEQTQSENVTIETEKDGVSSRNEEFQATNLETPSMNTPNEQDTAALEAEEQNASLYDDEIHANDEPEPSIDTQTEPEWQQSEHDEGATLYESSNDAESEGNRHGE